MTELTLRQKESYCLDIMNLLKIMSKPKPIKCYGLEDHQLSYERSCIKCGTSKKDLDASGTGYFDEREIHMNDKGGMCLECDDHKLCTCGQNTERLVTIP